MIFGYSIQNSKWEEIKYETPIPVGRSDFTILPPLPHEDYVMTGFDGRTFNDIWTLTGNHMVKARVQGLIYIKFGFFFPP
jgi:hypothetical protein